MMDKDIQNKYTIIRKLSQSVCNFHKDMNICHKIPKFGTRLQIRDDRIAISYTV